MIVHDDDEPMLTERHQYVVALRAKGLRYKEIAKKIGVSPAHIGYMLGCVRHKRPCAFTTYGDMRVAREFTDARISAEVDNRIQREHEARVWEAWAKQQVREKGFAEAYRLWAPMPPPGPDWFQQ